MANIIYSGTFREYLSNSDNKIASTLYQLWRKEYCRDNFVSSILTDKEIDYLTFRNDGTISFLPAGKPHKVSASDSSVWLRDGRQEGRPSKVIRKIFTKRGIELLKLKDSDFEAFVNDYKEYFNDGGYTFELLPASEIPNVYCMSREDGDCTLQNSCMNGDRSYLEIYKKCEVLNILILKNKEGELAGRALVWKINDKVTFMDRIYVAQDFLYNSFLSYCSDKGWWRKYWYKKYEKKNLMINPENGELTEKEWKIFTDTDCSYYPYIDTFTYGDDGMLSNANYYPYTYDNTDGTRDGDEDNHDGERYDDINDRWIDEDDAVYITRGERGYRDRWCHESDCVNVDGEWYYRQDDNIVEVEGDYYRTDSDDICLIDDEYYLSSDCVYSDESDNYILRDDAIEVDNNWYEKDSDKIVEVNGTWYTKDSDDIVEIDGDFYEKDSDDVVEMDGEYIKKQLEFDF